MSFSASLKKYDLFSILPAPALEKKGNIKKEQTNINLEQGIAVCI